MKLNATRITPVVSRVLVIALLTLSAWESAWAGEKVLVNFNGTKGKSPTASLIADAAGNLYGVTATGGEGCSPNPGCGVVFKLTSTSGRWAEKVLHTFTGGNDGAYPTSLIIDSEGNLYGTTVFGGGRGGPNCSAVGCGIVFRLTPAASGSWPEKVLYRFSGGDGALPNALAFDVHGNLFGTTLDCGGGSSCGGGNTFCNLGGCGVLFELEPTSSGPWKFTAIHTFLDVSTDGQGPQGLVFDAAGAIYVLTTDGGSSGWGAILQFVPGATGWSSTLIHSFGINGDGIYPAAGLIIDAGGNLYGTTWLDGAPSGQGMVFQLSPGANGAWTENILYNFGCCVDGKQPETLLAFDAGGNLYGTTIEGGGTGSKCSDGCGTVFKLTRSSSFPWPETLAIRFVGTNGARPAGGLVLNADGHLYGTAPVGGTANDGIVFELTP